MSEKGRNSDHWDKAHGSIMLYTMKTQMDLPQDCNDAAGVASSMRLPVTVIILTFNEEMHIERCLRRALSYAKRVVIVDSFSNDRTTHIAKNLGADVRQRAFCNQADQFQWALDNICIDTEWTMKLDADEYLEQEAIRELSGRLSALPAEVTGVEFRLKVVFRGKWIRHGRFYSTRLLRVWRSGIGSMEQRWMDEHIVLKHGRVELIRSGDLVDENLRDIGSWVDKHNRYATRHMVDFIGREFCLVSEDRRVEGTRSSARRRRFLRNHVYGRAPIYVRATLFYIYRYIFRLGFLDGREGFVFFFMRWWFSMLVDAKIDEARRFIATYGVEAFQKHLRDQHSIEI